MSGFPTLSDSSLIRYEAYVDGQWIEAEDRTTFDVRDPADGTVLGRLPALGMKETERAIEGAYGAFLGWRGMTAKERGMILRRWYDLILLHCEDLALIMGAEGGKPHTEARGEIKYGAAFVEWFAEEGKRVYGDVIPATQQNRKIVVLKEGIGVVGAITPWNFPHAMITRKCAPALAAGCSVVVKPSEETPFSAVALAVLAERAGIPRGVFNVVTSWDPVPVARALTGSPLVRKLSFTGSTEVGRFLMRECAETVKKVSLELGGNAPFIVFEDADLDVAVRGAVASKFRNTGQTCVCANRFFVHEGVYEEFIARFAQAISGLVVGSSRESGVNLGPLINEQALEKVQGLIQDAVQQGARLVTGGQPHPRGGLFYSPTLLTDVHAHMRIAQEEIFGPVAPVFRFGRDEQALILANATEYGLACYFYTQDIRRIWYVLDRLEYGMVGINESILSTEAAPFGGVKYSGFGREGSKYGIEEFVTTKYVCFGNLT